jgi:hypothetical protein
MAKTMPVKAVIPFWILWPLTLHPKRHQDGRRRGTGADVPVTRRNEVRSPGQGRVMTKRTP